VQITDWMPTFSAIAGFAPKGDLKWDGTDITKVLTSHAPLPDRPLYAVAPGWRARSLRFGQWKLVVTGAAANAKSELFDLATDSAEKVNLASSQPERLREMQAKLDAMAARDRDAVAKD